MTAVDASMLMLQVEPEDWRTLVRKSASVLERQGIIAPAYTDTIVTSLEGDGTYMVIAPRVLLAHARPEAGAVGTGISLLTTTEEIPLGDDPQMPVRLFFTLAAADSEAHLAVLQRLAMTLVDDALVNELATSSDPDRVAAILNPS